MQGERASGERGDALNAEQAEFRFEHKRYCFNQAIERGDYHAANIFSAQAAYWWRVMTGTELTDSNRNWFPS